MTSMRNSPETVGLLAARLYQFADKVDRIVVTGDLLNSPSKSDAQDFKNFRGTLQMVAKKDMIIIPGNHDQRPLGTFGLKLEQVADLHWSTFVIDDEMECVFFCFDSAREAKYARGYITQEQYLELGTAYELAVATKSLIDG